MRPLLRIVAAFAALAPAGVSAAHADSLTYENDRFGTTLTFPLDLFGAIAPPPANGDGRRFLAGDGAELAAYGRFNTLDQTPRSLVEWEAANFAEDGGEITCADTGEDWAVLSGRIGDEIVYRRHEFSADRTVIHSMELRYPDIASARYDGMAGTIAGTLKGP